MVTNVGSDRDQLSSMAKQAREVLNPQPKADISSYRKG